MTILTSILTTSDRIPLEYRLSKSLDEIRDELLLIKQQKYEITNQHVLNLISVLFVKNKQVVKIEDAGIKHTMDLEIADDSHSYYANGIPTHNTIIIPHDYAFENFKNLYLDVYNTGYIKGLTTYRSGTMASVLSAKEEKNADASDEEIIQDDIKLPDSLPATLKILRAEGKKWYVTVISNVEQTRPIALFVQTNHAEKTISTTNAVDHLFKLARDKGIPEEYIVDIEHKFRDDTNVTKIARAISLNLRHGVMIKNIVHTLSMTDNIFVGSFLFIIKKYLSTFIKDGEKAEGLKCESCGCQTIVYSEGCQKCSNCGISHCG